MLVAAGGDGRTMEKNHGYIEYTDIDDGFYALLGSISSYRRPRPPMGPPMYQKSYTRQIASRGCSVLLSIYEDAAALVSTYSYTRPIVTRSLLSTFMSQTTRKTRTANMKVDGGLTTQLLRRKHAFETKTRSSRKLLRSHTLTLLLLIQFSKHSYRS